MSFLLDTNVISELRKPPSRMHQQVQAWSASTGGSEMYLSVITLMEIEIGVARMERRDARQGAILRAWFATVLMPRFEGRTIEVSVPIAVSAAGLQVPDPRPLADCLIAATAVVHGLTVVTRNVRDFEPLGVATLNPWA